MQATVNFIIYFFLKFKQTNTRFVATFLAYHLLLAFIPLLIFVTQIVSFFAPNFQSNIYTMVNTLPDLVIDLLTPIIDSIFTLQSSSLSIVSVLSALWLGSRGFVGLIASLNEVFDIQPADRRPLAQRIPFFNRFFAMLYTVAFLGIIISLLALNLFNQQIVALFREFSQDLGLIAFASDFLVEGYGTLVTYAFAVAVFIFFFRFSTVFYKKASIPFDAAFFGSCGVTAGIFSITFVYKNLSQWLFRSQIYYGSLGGILITLIWLQFVCQTIVLGAVFIQTYIDVLKKKGSWKDLIKDKETGPLLKLFR